MSTLLVPIAKISAVKPHPNADRLSIAEVLGWQVVTGKDEFNIGDRVVYIPPDAVLPVELSDAFGVTQHLSKGRVRQVKLRGEPSFGFVVPINKVLTDDADVYDVGADLSFILGITKYEPPLRPSAGDADTPHPLLQKFTEVENFRNYPDILLPGEEVVITEKIHGTNCRIGVIEGEIMAGSMEIRRKRPTDEQLTTSIYWFPYTLPGVQQLLIDYGSVFKQVILYGEVYGKVQSLHYDRPNALGFRAFGLLLDGKYSDNFEFESLMDRYGIARVPVLYKGAFNKELLPSITRENSKLAPEQIMEGVVIQPVVERTDPKVGRVILKYLSNAYLFSKGVSDFKDV